VKPSSSKPELRRLDHAAEDRERRAIQQVRVRVKHRAGQPNHLRGVHRLPARERDLLDVLLQVVRHPAGRADQLRAGSTIGRGQRLRHRENPPREKKPKSWVRK
jgi:hypothetical protein